MKDTCDLCGGSSLPPVADNNALCCVDCVKLHIVEIRALNLDGGVAGPLLINDTIRLILAFRSNVQKLNELAMRIKLSKPMRWEEDIPTTVAQHATSLSATTEPAFDFDKYNGIK